MIVTDLVLTVFPLGIWEITREKDWGVVITGIRKEEKGGHEASHIFTSVSAVELLTRLFHNIPLQTWRLKEEVTAWPGNPEMAPYANFHFTQGRSFTAIFMPGSVATVGTSKTDR